MDDLSKTILTKGGSFYILVASCLQALPGALEPWGPGPLSPQDGLALPASFCGRSEQSQTAKLPTRSVGLLARHLGYTPGLPITTQTAAPGYYVFLPRPALSVSMLAVAAVFHEDPLTGYP